MPYAIQMDVKGEIFNADRLKIKIHQSDMQGIKALAGFAAKSYIRSAEIAGIDPWRGQFYRTLNRQVLHPTKINNNSYGIDVSPIRRGQINYFYALDKMRLHKVSLRKGRIITKWANSHGFDAGAIYVKPHPFRDSAEARVITNAHRIVSRKVKQGMESKR